MIDSKLVLRSFSKSIQFLQKFLNPIGNPSNASKDASISIISITQGGHHADVSDHFQKKGAGPIKAFGL